MEKFYLSGSCMLKMNIINNLHDSSIASSLILNAQSMS